MTNREKVVNGLRKMSCMATWKDVDQIRHKFQPIINGAVATLKEQELKYVNDIAQQISCFSGTCPKCGKMLNTTCNKNFCGECGQAVKWE